MKDSLTSLRGMGSLQGAHLGAAGDMGALMGWPWSAPAHGVLVHLWLLSDSQVYLQCCKGYFMFVPTNAKYLAIWLA